MKKLAAIPILGLTPGIANVASATDYMGIYINDITAGKIDEEDRNEENSTTPMNFYLSYDGSDYGVQEDPDEKNTLLVFGIGI